MHIVTITTTTPHGEVLNLDAITTAGTDTDALDQAAHLAANTSVALHAEDPYQHHAHLISINDEPHTVIPPRVTATGRTDLLATMRATGHLNP